MESNGLVFNKLNNSVIFTKNDPLSIIGWSIYDHSIFHIPFYKKTAFIWESRSKLSYGALPSSNTP